MEKIKYAKNYIITDFYMNQKAQASLEYLLTYGWALILVATIITVLVFVVGPRPGGVTFVSSDPTKIMLKAGGGSGDKVSLILQNATGGRITINEFGATSNYTDCTLNGAAPVGLSIPAGIEMRFECNLTPSGGDPAGGIRINYTDYSNLDRSVSVTAKTTTGGEIEPIVILGPELLSNPGFESGTDGWSLYNDKTATSIVLGGDCHIGKCLKVTGLVSSGTTTWRVQRSALASVQVVAGKKYQLGYWSKHNQNLTNMGITVFTSAFAWSDTTTNALVETNYFNMGSVNETWHYETQTFTAPATATMLLIRIGFVTPYMVTTSYFSLDEVSLKEVK